MGKGVGWSSLEIVHVVGRALSPAELTTHHLLLSSSNKQSDNDDVRSPQLKPV